MSEIEYKPAGLVDKAALEHFKTKRLLPGFSHYDVWLYQHSLAFTVAKMMDADMLADTKQAIEQALQNGTGFADFKKRLKPYLMAKGWWGEQIMTDPADGVQKLVQLGSTRRLKTIFNTNMQTAFAAGQWQRIQANKAALPYLRYNASAAGTPRDSHKRYYGMILPVDHEIWQVVFPPNGYGCKCSVSALTRRQAEREGISGEPDVEMVEFINPRTGQTVLIPDDITPSFAHNHGDRLGAMAALAADRHGQDFLNILMRDTQAYLDSRIRQPEIAKRFSGSVVFADGTQDSYVIAGQAFDKQDLAQLAGVIDDTELSFRPASTPNEVYFAILPKNADVYEKMYRYIYNKGNALVLYNETQTVKETMQGQGVAAFALREQIRAAKRLGIQAIETFAAGELGDKYNGYYTWARLGFNGKIPDDIAKRLPDGLKQAVDIADLMQSDSGREFWRKNGRAFAAEFDLAEGSKSLATFAQYLLDKYGVLL